MLAPRLVTRGRSVPLALPAAATDPASPACATVLALSSSNSVLSLTFEQADEGQRRDFPLASSLGVIEVVRCGPRKAALAGISLDSSSPHAVVSLLVAVGEAPAESSLSLLPHRHPGPSATAPQLGPRPLGSPISERLAQKRRLRALDGASSQSEGTLRGDDTGSARAPMSLSAGCHTFDVLDAGPDAGLADLDARAVTSDGHTLGQDDSVAPDASFSFCIGEPRAVTLDVRGTSAAAELAWLHASSALPDGLPVEWGPRARARLAEALQSERSQALSERPIAFSVGVQGQTRLKVEVAPGRCYLAAVAALDRTPEELGLAASAGGRTSQVRPRAERPGAALTVCATSPLLDVEVQSRGAGASWLVGVWELERSAVP